MYFFFTFFIFTSMYNAWEHLSFLCEACVCGKYGKQDAKLCKMLPVQQRGTACSEMYNGMHRFPFPLYTLHVTSSLLSVGRFVILLKVKPWLKYIQTFKRESLYYSISLCPICLHINLYYETLNGISDCIKFEWLIKCEHIPT